MEIAKYQQNLVNENDMQQSLKKKESLPFSKKTQIQAKISHYFKGLRARLGLSQHKFAHFSGYSEAQIKQLENSDKYSMLVNSYETVCEAASLEGLSLTDFLTYIDLDNMQSPHRKLFKWEKIVLEKFSQLSFHIRRNFIHKYLINTNEPDFVEIVDLLQNWSQLKKNDQELIKSLIKRLNKISKKKK